MGYHPIGQLLLKTQCPKPIQKHIQEQGAHLAYILVPKLWQWIVQ